MQFSAGTGSFRIEWGVAERAYPGERVSGDMAVVHPYDGGILIGVVDALGHGVDAQAAASTACEALKQMAGAPATDLVEDCHRILQGSRGVALALATLDTGDRTMTWLGVGNIEGVLWRSDAGDGDHRTSLVTRGGIVGARLPGLRPEVVRVGPGDVVVFATDGVSHQFAESRPPPEPPDTVAETLLSGFGRETDDALVLALRVAGAPD